MPAVDTVDLSVLFPVITNVFDSPYWDEDEENLLGLLRYESLTLEQEEAINTIIDTRYQSYPTIICGPFGCGKTKTITVATKLISMSTYKTRVLIVTKTNSCANLYIELLEQHFDTLTMLRERRLKKNLIMYRHFGMKQSIFWNKRVNEYANIVNGEYQGVSFEELEQCTVVVTTTTACGKLIQWNDRRRSKSLFTHIFIDEAAQVIEPEACIALSLAGASTKIALAGDIHQSRPLVLSKYGKKYHLDQSLLERLEMLPEYETEELYKCKVNLVENFRSQHLIVEFLSELFYDNTLVANPPSLVGPTNFPALSFLHVNGDEQSLYGFPSYYNEEEAHLTMKALRKFVTGGVKVDKIAVLTTYKAQEYLLKEALKQEGSNCKRARHSRYDCIRANCINNRTIEYRKLESIQGREYDLIIVNTVRTVSEVPEDLSLEERLDLGLLDDVTQFNTILTRARGWVLVIGDVDCLTRVGGCSNVWSKYVEACEQVNGFFRTYMELEAFKMKIGDTKETKGPSLRIPKKEDIPKSKVSIASTAELPPLGPPEQENLKIPQDEVMPKSKVPIASTAELPPLGPPEQENLKIPQDEVITKSKVPIASTTELPPLGPPEQENLKIPQDEVITKSKVPIASTTELPPLGPPEQENLKIPQDEVMPKSKVPIASTAELPPLGPPEQVNTVDTFEVKLNLLQSYIATCQQELETLTDQNIIRSIHEQLQFTKITLEILERQRHLQGDTRRDNIPRMQTYTPMQYDGAAYSPAWNQIATPQLMQDMILPQGMLPPNQLFYSEGPQQNYF